MDQKHELLLERGDVYVKTKKCGMKAELNQNMRRHFCVNSAALQVLA